MNKKGFTLIELLAVIVILGIVVAIAIPGINSVISNSRQKSVLAEANIIHSAAIRKLGEYPDFDFSKITKENLKEHLEVDGSVYEDVVITNNKGKITVFLSRYGIRANANGNDNHVSKNKPYIAYEFDLSLGSSYVNIHNDELIDQEVYVYIGNFNDNKLNINNNFKNPDFIWTDLAFNVDLRDKLNVNNGVYTVVASKFLKTGQTAYSGDKVIYNKGLISVPHFDIVELKTNDLSHMFFGADAFNQNINHWDISNVTRIARMFWMAQKFNQPLDNWNTSNLVNIDGVFHQARKFNQDINSWNTTNVKDMRWAFYSATEFDQDLYNWDVSNVTAMRNMFLSAKAFSKNISNWDTKNVTLMDNMFNATNNFNQDVSNWNVNKVSEWTNFNLNSSLENKNIPTKFR